jgi:uncharacterized protein with HEPN domain
MRPEKLYLNDIVEAADAIQRFLHGRDYDDFSDDECVGAPFCKAIVLERPPRLSAESGDSSWREWPDIVGFRNIAIHECLPSGGYRVGDGSSRCAWLTANRPNPGR